MSSMLEQAIVDAQALKEAEGDEDEAEHIYFDYIRSQFQNN